MVKILGLVVVLMISGTGRAQRRPQRRTGLDGAGAASWSPCRLVGSVATTLRWWSSRRYGLLVGGAWRSGVGGARRPSGSGSSSVRSCCSRRHRCCYCAAAAIVAGAAGRDHGRGHGGATRTAAGWPPPWPYAILAVVLLLRGGQAVREGGRDPVSQGLLPTLRPRSSWSALRWSARSSLRLTGSAGRASGAELGDELGSVGFAVAAALIVLCCRSGAPAVVQTVARSTRDADRGVRADPASWWGPGGSATVSSARLSCSRSSTRARPSGPGMVLGCIGVMLVVLAGRWCWGHHRRADRRRRLTLVATGRAGRLVGHPVRRRLTGQRPVASPGSDPVGLFSAETSCRPLGCARLSGAALVLFGLTGTC